MVSVGLSHLKLNTGCQTTPEKMKGLGQISSGQVGKNWKINKQAWPSICHSRRVLSNVDNNIISVHYNIILVIIWKCRDTHELQQYQCNEF